MLLLDGNLDRRRCRSRGRSEDLSVQHFHNPWESCLGLPLDFIEVISFLLEEVELVVPNKNLDHHM